MAFGDVFDFVGDAAPGFLSRLDQRRAAEQDERREDRLEREFEARMEEVRRGRELAEQERQLQDQQAGIRRGVTEGSVRLGAGGERLRTRGEPLSTEQLLPELADRDVFAGADMAPEAAPTEDRQLMGRGVGMAGGEPEGLPRFEEEFGVGARQTLEEAPDMAMGGTPFASIDREAQRRGFLASPEGQQAQRELQKFETLKQTVIERFPDRALEVGLAQDRDDLLDIMRDARDGEMPDQPSITEQRFMRDTARDQITATIQNMVVGGASPDEVVNRLGQAPGLMQFTTPAEIRAEARQVLREEEEREQEATATGPGGGEDVEERRDAWERELGAPRTAIQQDALDLLADGISASQILETARRQLDALNEEEQLTDEEFNDLESYLRIAVQFERQRSRR